MFVVFGFDFQVFEWVDIVIGDVCLELVVDGLVQVMLDQCVEVCVCKDWIMVDVICDILINFGLMIEDIFIGVYWLLS